MRKEQELTIITKTYDLILWSCNHTSRFPRNHRFVLGERIERNLYALLEALIRAKYNKSRQRLLRGGSFNNQPSNVRSANRNWNQPANRNNNYGFRPASTWQRVRWPAPPEFGRTLFIPKCAAKSRPPSRVGRLCRARPNEEATRRVK
jgi:hypothetical protein